MANASPNRCIVGMQAVECGIVVFCKFLMGTIWKEVVSLVLKVELTTRRKKINHLINICYR